jgi:hypothetical protein
MPLEDEANPIFLAAKLFGTCNFKIVGTLIAVMGDLQLLQTADQVFEALGGNVGVQAVTCSKPTQVSNWRKFGAFPSNTYVAMTEALRERGKTAPPALWRMRVREGA